MFNDDRLATASLPKWRRAEIRNHCQLSDVTEDISQFRDYKNGIKFSRCILKEEVRKTTHFH